MPKVFAPNKQYTGLSAGVTFVNGVGETDIPHVLDWFREHGYIVEEGDPPAAVVADGPPVNTGEPDSNAEPTADPAEAPTAVTESKKATKADK
jgi:hypothetical protein